MHNQFSHLQDLIGATGIVLIYMLLHLLAGLFSRKGRPFLFALVENAGEEIDRRLNRLERGSSELFMRGIVVAGVMIAFGLLIGGAVEKISGYDFGWMALILFLFATVTVMGPLNVLRRVSRALSAGKLQDAARELQPCVKEDLSAADEYTLIRRAIEYSAVSLNNYFIAPLFFFIIFKPFGLAVYVMIGGLYEAYGMNDSKHLMFGGIVRGLEKAFDFIPARLTAFLIIFSALFVSRSNPLRGFEIAISQAIRYRSVNRGWLIAAMAGGLGITLGGPLRHRKGHTVEHGWIGPVKSSAKVSVEDLKRATMLHFVALLCAMMLLSVFLAFQKQFS